MKENDTVFMGKVALILGAGYALISVLVPLVNTFLKTPIQLGTDLSIPYIVCMLAAFMVYVYGRLEHCIENQEKILNQPAQGVEIFRSSDEFLRRLAEVTEGAENVSTLNLSAGRGVHTALDRYFDKVHRYIKAHHTALSSFRSLASIDDNTKVNWILQRCDELYATGKTSFAVMTRDARDVPPLCFHIVYKEDGYYAFFYPPVSLEGVMDSFLIKNESVALVMLKYFDSLWNKSAIMNSGRQIKPAGLELIRSLHPDITTNEFYKKLVARAV